MFVKNSLKLIGSFGVVGPRGQGLYGYSTDDTKATVEGSNYFGGAASLLQVGDIIMVAGDLDGTPFTADYTVSSNDGTTVALTEKSSVTQNVLQEITMDKISSKASDAEVFRYVPSFAGNITKLYSVLNAALATGDATFQAKINGTNVTNGLITATQSGSAAGDVDVATPTAANAFVAGDVISITGGGASTATATANVTLQLTPA